MLTIPIALGTVLLLAIWLVFLSRMPWSRRRWAIGAAVAVIAMTAATTRIRGVTGDLVPILEWRWASRRPSALPAESVPESPRSTPVLPKPVPAPSRHPPTRRGCRSCRSCGFGTDRGDAIDSGGRRLPAIPRRRPQWHRLRHSHCRRLGKAAASARLASANRRGMVRVRGRWRPGGHAGAARQPRDGRGLRPRDRRAEVVSRRRGALRVDDCRRRPSRDANHLARARLHPWVDGTPQLPRPRNRPQPFGGGTSAPTISRRSPISAGAARRSPSTI